MKEKLERIESDLEQLRKDYQVLRNMFDNYITAWRAMELRIDTIKKEINQKLFN